LLTVPLWAFRLAVTILRRLPRYRQWSAAMAERMNRDLVFDHTDAAHLADHVIECGDAIQREKKLNIPIRA
jgi:hypothetical protein